MDREINKADMRVGMCLVFTKEWGQWFKNVKVGSRLKIKDRQTLNKLVRYNVQNVTIDTDKGLDIRIPIAEERKKAKEFLNHAKDTVVETMSNVADGKDIDMGAVNTVTREINSSLLRNEDALISVCNEVRSVDAYLYLHCVNVSTLAMIFGREMSFSDDMIHKMAVGAILHDSGKTRTPTEILHKPGRFTDEEFEVMKIHAEESEKIVTQIPGLSSDSVEVLVASQHHEKYDGSGYPRGLKGDKISVQARIAAYLDVYDALTADRCYKKGMSVFRALQIIKEGVGTHFDPQLMPDFLNTIGVFPVGSLVLLKSRRIGKVIERGTDQNIEKPTVLAFYDDARNRPINNETVSLIDEDDEVESFAPIEKYKLYKDFAPSDVKFYDGS